MTVTLELDSQKQRTLEAAFGRDLSRSALEALATEGYRSGKLTRFDVQQLMGLPDRWATETWLKQRQAYPPLTVEDVLTDFASSQKAIEVACSVS